VDTADPENIRLITQVDGRAITLLAGDGNYSQRYQHFVKKYQEIVKRSPAARIFDMRLDDRITVKE
jgi:menaquinone-dependent protoporphyrinogen IX oxidase